MSKVAQYISDVLSGREIAGRYCKLAVERHVNDLKRKDIYFDEKAALRAIKFFGLLKHTKGRNFSGKPFELSGWQEFIVYSLFGWMKPDGARRFRLSYTEVGKKNGKSTLAAGLGLYLFIADQEPGAEIYSAATQRDQAKIVFNEARNMVKTSGLADVVTVFTHNMHIDSTFSKFEPVSSDQDSFEGKNPYCCIIDEFHAHKDDLLFNNIKAATVARNQSLVWIITTAGFNKESPCFHFRKMCIDVLEGKLTDDGLFAIIFSLDPEDDWKDKRIWKKSNPNLGISVLQAALESEFQQAVNSTTAEVGFKTKNLNIWTDSSAVWIPDEKWQKCNDRYSEEEAYPPLKGAECWASLDLSSTTDITCFGLLFKKELFYWMPFFFLPELTMHERVRRDHVNYDKWIREGYIEMTGGDVVDYEYVKAKIDQLSKEYKIKSIQYDRWNSSQLVNNLVEAGANMMPFGQGYQSMSAPTKEIEKMVLSGQINFAGNPVMRWMASNVDIRTDPAGNLKMDKSKSIEKIDGMVALAMALGGYMTDTNKGSVYDRRGILTI